MNLAFSTDPDIARTLEILGGTATIRTPVNDDFAVHDLLAKGLPAAALLYLEHQVGLLSASAGAMERAVGISPRTLQRRKAGNADALLNPEQSSRTWKFAEILGLASEVFSSRAAAEDWMIRPAIGLDHRKPLDMMATPVGARAVENYLGRIKYAVYT